MNSYAGKQLIQDEDPAFTNTVFSALLSEKQNILNKILRWSGDAEVYSEKFMVLIGNLDFNSASVKSDLYSILNRIENLKNDKLARLGKSEAQRGFKKFQVNNHIYHQLMQAKPRSGFGETLAYLESRIRFMISDYEFYRAICCSENFSASSDVRRTA